MAISKKKQQAFNKAAEALLIKLGAKVLEKPVLTYQFSLNTPIGEIFFHLPEDQGVCFTLFGNFLNDFEKAKSKLGHWKYNAFISNMPIKDALTEIENHVKFLLK